MISIDYRNAGEFENGIKEINKFIENSVIVCIGTDKVIGDSTGPFVGTFLKEADVPLTVYGTLKEPVNYKNIDSILREIAEAHGDKKIVAIDSSLGSRNELGNIIIDESPISPGSGLRRSMVTIGDYSIKAVVFPRSSKKHFTLPGIRLNFIVDMAKAISRMIISAYYYNS